MEIKELPLDEIRPYPGNPRKISKKAIDKVAASLREFGPRQPIVVDKKMVVVVGHARLAAAKKIGLKTFPVHVADLTAAKAKAYRLADNRSNEEARWDLDLLTVELEGLAGLDFDLSLTGFDPGELERAMKGEISGAADAPAPGLPRTPVSGLGDVWILGEHRLVCGDATVDTVVERCLDGTVPHLMVTDPPYGFDYDPAWRNRRIRSSGKPVGARAVGGVRNDDETDWREAWKLFPGDVAYVWHGGLKAHISAASLEASGFELRSHIIWVKNNIAIGRSDYHFKHEVCWYAVRTGRKGHWNGDRKQATVWEIDKPMKSETGHSTQKPVECMRRPILNNSIAGDSVYDPFSGSGTTIIAAEMEGRICHAIELEPGYVDVAVLRWERFAERDAVLEATGKTFKQVQRARRRRTKAA